MTATAASEELEVLDDQTCIQLLTSHHFGRMAFAHESWPLILPVNYVYAEPNVIIRTGPGAKLDFAPMTAVAFEVDDAGLDGTWGWSVVVQGPAFDITDSNDAYSTQLRLAGVEPAAPGRRDHWLKITAINLSGRRFGPVLAGAAK